MTAERSELDAARATIARLNRRVAHCDCQWCSGETTATGECGCEFCEHRRANDLMDRFEETQ